MNSEHVAVNHERMSHEQLADDYPNLDRQNPSMKIG